ncbi:hypothetical protein [Herbidospora cretacea]|uniref:hypothetical protein n=1 Tax=Herbidospora cretacea TaxID=28444 RepID=UPI0004C3D7E2|nr:hypothetical protein [Herbidospora cretacea]
MEPDRARLFEDVANGAGRYPKADAGTRRAARVEENLAVTGLTLSGAEPADQVAGDRYDAAGRSTLNH